MIRTPGILALYLVIILSWGAMADTSFGRTAPAQHLPSCFTSLNGFQGDFSQLVRDERDIVVHRQEGRVENLRPGNLRWEILSPYRELLLSNGKTLLHYQEDLAQVREYPLHDSPLPALLDGTSQTADGDASLHLEILSQDKTLQNYEIDVRLHTAESPQRYALVFQRCLPHSIRWRDALGQSVEIIFSNMNTKVPSAGRFDFQVPPGVDIFRDAD